MQKLLDRGRIDEPTVAMIIEQLLISLFFLSEHRIVHGNIKPENIFLRNDGSVVLGDFG